MDQTGEIKQKKNPREGANFLSVAFFWWLTPLLWKGSKDDLKKEDLYRVMSEDESQVLGDQLEREWKKELEHKSTATKSGSTYNPSLTKAIIRAFGFKFALLGIYTFWEECILRLFQPLFMSWFIKYFSTVDSGISKYEAYGYGAGIVAMSALYTFTHHQYFFGVMHTGMKLRVAHCSFIYRKSLKLSKKALGQSTIGQMVNLLSNDVNRFDMTPFFLHYLWCGPLQFMMVMYLTWDKIGASTFIGGALIIAFVPLQSWIGRVFSRLRNETAKKTDERIRLMSEIIQGIRVIKMYAWENSFAKLVQEARKAEINVVQKTYFYKAFNMCFFFTSSRLVMAIIFLSYVLMGDILTAEKAFLTLALFNVVRLSMTLFFPGGIQMGSEALISIKRIQEFLELEELDETSSSAILNHTTEPEKGICVKMDHVCGKWNYEDETNTLEDITFEAKGGQLCAIIGPVGSGKGSILNAVLGEMPTHAGCIKVNGKISYASQEAWVFSGNLRQNILFGQPYHPDRYANVLEVCSLNRDIKGFDHGDQTMVGERGVALSGGQKARVNLARAIYREADIYLLDDPLSAVDSHVGRHLFDKCIKTFLKEKVVILVTHQLQYLKGADDILVLRQGKITHQGDYDSIVKSCTDISNFMTQEKDDDDDENVEKIKKIEVNCDEKVDQENEKAALLPSADKPAVDKNEEVSKIGNVSKNVYFGYLKSGANLCTGLVLTVATICTHGFFTLSDLWIAKWTNTEDVQLEQYQHHLFNDTLLTMENVTMDPSLLNDELQKEFHHIQESNQFNLMVYALLVLGLVIACSVQTVQYYVICMNASRNLHNKMFNKLLRAPPYFFDVNPSGRILNRFSKDMGCIDEVLPMTILDVKWLFLNIFCVFLLVIYIRPLVLIPTLVVAVIFVLLRKFYLQTSRSVKRIEGVTRSPVFSQLSTSLNGLTTIRAFKAQDMLVAEFDNIQDIHSSAWFTYLGTTRWFGVYLDWIVVIYLACCVLSFLLMPDDVLGGDVGVAISSCIFLTGALQYGMRQSAEAENLMTSVERVMEYGDLASEADLTSGNPDDESDKEQGIVEFDHVFLTYGLQSDAEKSSSSKAVLKDITFETKAQEKIGIVGRTGAGKSSLIVAIFRLSEPSGVIRIDGKDISKMGLHDLRKKISIIPQDPLLFTTSLRQNLDPFDQYSDADIWSALEQANLAKVVRDLKDGLSTKMSEGGSNLSVGQRQLVCLARAILRRNKILILDEATANVDPKTDSLIQETIRTQFKDCTVFTVAHRLHTVMDSDRILVMDDGKVKEFDVPIKLLENPDGMLSKLVGQTGPQLRENLLQIAKEAFETSRANNHILQ